MPGEGGQRLGHGREPGLGYFGVGYPPDEEEMAEIRALFEEAGIPTENYQALR